MIFVLQRANINDFWTSYKGLTTHYIKLVYCEKATQFEHFFEITQYVKTKKSWRVFFKFIWPSQNILTLQGSLAGATKATYAVVNVRSHWGN